MRYRLHSDDCWILGTLVHGCAPLRVTPLGVFIQCFCAPPHFLRYARGGGAAATASSRDAGSRSADAPSSAGDAWSGSSADAAPAAGDASTSGDASGAGR